MTNRKHAISFLVGVTLIACSSEPQSQIPSPSGYCWNMWNLRTAESQALGIVDPTIIRRAAQCDKDVSRLDDQEIKKSDTK